MARNADKSLSCYYKVGALAELFGVDLNQLDSLPAEKYRLFEEVSSITHLSKDDPPAMLTYNRPLNAEITSQSVGIHHPKFGVMLKEKMDALGIRCEVYAGREQVGGGARTTPIEFIKQAFGMQ